MVGEGKKMKDVGDGRSTLILGVVGLLIAGGMWAVMAKASVMGVTIPIPNTTRITIVASVTSFTYGPDDSLILNLKVEVTSRHPKGTNSIVWAMVAAYSDPDILNATRYAGIVFPNVLVPGGETTTFLKVVRVHHASMAAMDHDAFFVAMAVERVDGTVLTAQDTATVDTARFISMLGI